MTGKLDWNVEGRDWPHRSASRFLEAGGLRWHVQIMGKGPALVLLHGTGAATHSWRGLAPILAQTYTIVAPDLPGHGFTSAPQRSAGYSLPNVARSVALLLDALEVSPHALIGHSAGAAIAVRMVLDGDAPPAGVVGVNAALLPFPGLLGPWAPTLARMFFYNPFSLAVFAHRASQPGAIAELMRSTGSSIDEGGLEFYERLFRSKSHLASTIALMAHWDLAALKEELPRFRAPLTLLVGENDRAVRPAWAAEVQGLIKQARIETTPGLGHLAHEEDPDRVGALILGALQQG